MLAADRDGRRSRRALRYLPYARIRDAIVSTPGPEQRRRSCPGATPMPATRRLQQKRTHPGRRPCPTSNRRSPSPPSPTTRVTLTNDSPSLAHRPSSATSRVRLHQLRTGGTLSRLVVFWIDGPVHLLAIVAGPRRAARRSA